MSTESTAVREARKNVNNLYGKHLADKASDAFCLAFGLLSATSADSSDFAEAMPTVQTRAAVLEFATDGQKLADLTATGKKVRERKEWTQLQKAIRKLPLAESFASQSLQMFRQAKIHSLRDDFYKISGVVTNEVGRGVRGFQLGPEATASPVTPSAVTERCWLNRTMRTWVNPQLLAEVAADESIKRIGVPRRLEAEAQLSMQTVGAPQYRQKFNFTGKDIIVAVIDSEVALFHPALQDRVVQKKNYSKELWGNPGFHGTAVAGIIAAAASGEDFFGVAPAATIYNYKVLATNRFLNADDFGGALAIQQALEDGAHIANCSWGAGIVGDGSSRESRACDTAWALGMSIVKSAGNRGLDDGMLTTPADADGIIVVGATDQSGRSVQDYSSHGPTPTGKIRPHLVAPGGSNTDGITCCLTGGGFAASIPGAVFAGTSFAAPHVAGILALMLEKEPDLTPDEQRDLLLTYCTPFNPNDRDFNGEGLVSLAKLLAS